MIEIRLLGSVDLKGSEGQTLRSVLAQPKRVALLAYLAVATPRGYHRRDKLLGLFWPESDQEHGRGALRKALYFLRQSLGEEVIVSRGDEEIGLAESALWCDAVAFEKALEAGRPEEALELYRGDLLEGFFIAEAPEFERWLEGERERLRRRAAEAAWTLVEETEAAGNGAEAANWARKAVSFSPNDEAAFRRLLALLDRLGDRTGAIEEYEAFARHSQEEYETEPSPETRALIAAIREREVAVPGARTAAEQLTTGVEAERSTEVGSPGADPVAETKRRWPLAVAAAAVLLVAVLTWYAGWGRSNRPVADGKSVAVLPFVNLGGDPSKEYFSDGVTDEIINRLGKVADLKVISYTSVMQYKETDKNLRRIGDELGVATIVEGQVLQIGDRVRINAQLIDAKTDIHLWADQYERQVADVFEIQSDIAKRVVTALQATLTPEARERIERKPTENLEAYDLYLLGRHRWVLRGVKDLSDARENLRDAIWYFEAAIEQDSAFALAWTGLADAWNALPAYDPVAPREAHARGREAAQRALDLDADLAEVHTALGGLALYHEWDWDRAEAHLLRAVELNPNWAQAHHYLGMAQCFQRRWERGLQSLQTAVSLNPLAGNFENTLAIFLYGAGRVDEALALDSPSSLYPSLMLVQQGRTEEALREIQRWGEAIGYRNPERLQLVLRAIEAPELTEEALAVLEDARRTTGEPFLTFLYLNLDAPVEALRIVQELIAQRHPIVPLLGTRLTPTVLQNPEIRAALQDVGVTIY